MHCSGSATTDAPSAAASRATRRARSVFDFTAPTVVLTLAIATRRSLIDRDCRASGRGNPCPGVEAGGSVEHLHQPLVDPGVRGDALLDVAVVPAAERDDDGDAQRARGGIDGGV